MARAQNDFWSRRRAAVAEQEAAEADALRVAEAARAQEVLEQEQAEKTDEDILSELGLRDPDLMGLGDDFASFMQSAVPEHLRQRALRRLWRSNPVLANLDGLIDFGEDYTDAATVVPGMQTSYQVGRGLMQHITALADQAEAERIAAEPVGAERIGAERIGAVQVAPIAPGTAAQSASEPAAFPLGDTAEAEMPTATTASVDVHSRPDPQTPPQNPRRHMRFAFAD